MSRETLIGFIQFINLYGQETSLSRIYRNMHGVELNFGVDPIENFPHFMVDIYDDA